ncbi:MAG: metalloprotease TldD [Pseudomonadota bacterium]|nr:metalloprotease TldD [Gammaproteobacteria bacterium]
MAENKQKIAESVLLEPSQLTLETLAPIFHEIHTRPIDWGDLYLQSIQTESWILEDSIIKHASFRHEKGFGLRVIAGEKIGFAYSEAVNLPEIKRTARFVKAIADQGVSVAPKMLDARRVPKEPLYSASHPFQMFAASEKQDVLREVDRVARQEDPRVKQVIASLAGSYEVVLVLGSDGSFACDVRPLVRLNVTVFVEDGDRREQSNVGGGGRYDYSTLLKQDCVSRFSKEAVRQALVNLNAVEAPAGQFPVVLGPGWTGVLLHESVGHGLEGDFIRKGFSAFSNRLGQQVASKYCTIIDDGTLPYRRGSLEVDDEGTLSQSTVLIEKGILKNIMLDKQNAQLMGMKPTGNGRRESYACAPIPRMTNTFMLGGDYAPEEIIQSVKKGLYVANMEGGQVDITSGKFVFTTSEAYLIEQGKITAPVKGATLIGDGPSILKQVSMVGNDLALDPGVGICGKDGQSVPVGVGQPTLKLDAITVGGTVS